MCHEAVTTLFQNYLQSIICICECSRISVHVHVYIYSGCYKEHMSHQRWCRSVQLVSSEYNVLCLETFVMYHMIMYFTSTESSTVTCKRDKTQNVHVSHIIHCIIVNWIMMTEELDEVEFKAVDITGRSSQPPARKYQTCMAGPDQISVELTKSNSLYLQ